jgi:hypothetical protein
MPIQFVKSGFVKILTQTAKRRQYTVHFITFFACGLLFGLTLLGLISFIATVVQGSLYQSAGYIFTLLSLSFGLLFFIYSMKYYLTIAAVLSYTRKKQTGGKTLWWQRLFNNTVNLDSKYAHSVSKKLALPYTGKNGLAEDVSTIVLERLPFISIHLSTYNEKRVIERLLTAATAMQYPHFEVIVADDSSDETHTLLEKWASHPRVKISHRTDRSGYKGGALREALKLVDPRTEFILLFDADFIP